MARRSPIIELLKDTTIKKGLAYVCLSDAWINFKKEMTYLSPKDNFLYNDSDRPEEIRDHQEDFKLSENHITTGEVASPFESIIENTLLTIKETLIVKGKEYVRDGNPFHNFEVGARKKNISREKVLDGFALKHFISIEDMVNDLDKGIQPKTSAVEEKYNDAIIYLLIQKAMMIENSNK